MPKLDREIEEKLRYRVPAVLIGAALLLHVAYFLWTHGWDGFLTVGLSALGRTAIHVAIGLVLYLTVGPLFSLSFDSLSSTICKLIAVIALSNSVGLLLPDWLGTLGTGVLFLLLLYALFDMEGAQPFLFAGLYVAACWGVEKILD